MASPETTLGRLLASRRNELGLTQEEVANRAGFGTSSLRALEAGGSATPHGPGLFRALRLLAALELDASALEPLLGEINTAK